MKYYKINIVVDLLIHHAVDGKILSNEAYRVAKEAGISVRTVERAKREASIKSGRGTANERIWIIPSDIKITRTPTMIPRSPRPDLPIAYMNQGEQTGSTAEVLSQTHSSKEVQELDVSNLKRIFLVCTASKFSGKFDAFAVRVPRALEENILIGDAFVFCNSIKTQISVLQWQGDGFAQYFKRSDYGRFPWPTRKDVGAIEITQIDLKMLLEYPRLMLRLSGVYTPHKIM
jgi:hypothetical protein